jgi:phycoerythrin-associated linker protein
LEMIPECSGEAMESLIQAVYRQILGNAYVMESERTIPQSQFKLGQLSVRECF